MHIRLLFNTSSPDSFMEYTESSVLLAPGAQNSSDKDLQRAEGSCRLVVGGSEKGTRVVDIYQKSPIRVLFPRASSGRLEEAVLVNTAGGVAGGDRLQTNVIAREDASLAITTQAAEKLYRALKDSARIFTTLQVQDTAKLAWLPQEAIVFDRARLSRSTHIEITSGTELLALESLVLGRAAHGERFSAGTITDRWRVLKDGRLVWADNFRITEDVLPHLGRKALLSECTALATLVYFGNKAAAHLALVRDLASSFECQCAATLLSGLMIVRFASRTSYDLRVALLRLLQQLNNGFAPGPFRVPRMWAC
jgi:urease accessory protein